MAVAVVLNMGRKHVRLEAADPEGNTNTGWWPEVLGPLPVLLPDSPTNKGALCPVSWSGYRT